MAHLRALPGGLPGLADRRVLRARAAPVLATKRGDGKGAVLSVQGDKVTYTKRDVTVGIQPSGMEVFPDGTLAAICVHGNEDGDNDEITLIDLTRQPFRAVERITVGQTPEGLAISPDGRWLAVSTINGTNLPKASRPFWAEHGIVTLFSMKAGKAEKVSEVAVGKNNQGVAFSGDGRYLFVENYAEKELAAYRVTARGLEDTGVRLKLPGHPASIRTAPR
jgi:DNA-binding beta-propeller fold protein YncE